MGRVAEAWRPCVGPWDLVGGLGVGDLSPHFSRHEFACKCPRKAGPAILGRCPAKRPDVNPFLLIVLEQIRKRAGRPVDVVSGVRCTWWNRRQGGVRNSQHPRGTAADIRPGLADEGGARRSGARGVGVDGDGWAVHVDVRPGPRSTWEYLPGGGRRSRRPLDVEFEAI